MALCCDSEVVVASIADACSCAELRFACNDVFNPSRPSNSNPLGQPTAQYSVNVQVDDIGEQLLFVDISRAYNYPHDDRTPLARLFAYEADFYVYGVNGASPVFYTADHTATFDDNGDGAAEWLWKNLSGATHAAGALSDDPIDLVGTPIGSTGLSLPSRPTLPSGTPLNSDRGHHRGWKTLALKVIAKPDVEGGFDFP